MADPDAIGRVSAPPFARLPDSINLFAERAARFRSLAPGHELGPYLRLLAELSDLQHGIQHALPEPETPLASDIARSREFGMPPLDRTRFPEQEVCRETLRRFLAGAAAIDMPAPALAALDRVTKDKSAPAWLARNVVQDAIPLAEIAEHVFVAAGLQVHAARAAKELDPKALVPVGDGACPVCGSPPSSSVIVGWEGAHGARYCSCSLCGTLWNYVRIRCTACGSTASVSYQQAEGGSPNIKAEICGECRTYLKVMHQTQNPGLDPVADDVASAGLDLLVSEIGVRRSGVNPFLTGY
jgi:FdhE protein